ncbi:MAG: hypothetical protein NC319_09690 [Butyricicoccus sp.]|nr:hypothetical protein [Butyricicoccus sp.]
MEYPFYLEQKYVYASGRVEARLLTATEAQSVGYEDGCTATDKTWKMYVDGFNSAESSIQKGRAKRGHERWIRT